MSAASARPIPAAIRVKGSATDTQVIDAGGGVRAAAVRADSKTSGSIVATMSVHAWRLGRMEP